MAGFSQIFFPMASNAVTSADITIQESFPGLRFEGLEVNEQYQEIREIQGSLWFVTNASYVTSSLSPTAANAWLQSNPAYPSWAFVLDGTDGNFRRFTAAAVGGTGTPAITFASTTIALGLPLPIASGGTGNTTPGLVGGTNITITGTWPNQTISATGAIGVSSVTGSGNIASSGGANPNITTVATPTFTAVLSEAGATSAGYCPPVFTTAGAVTANTHHIIQSVPSTNVTLSAATQGSTTITLTNEAIFAGTNTYSVVACFDGTGGFAPTGAVINVLRSSSSSFTIYVNTATTTTATFGVYWIASGT